jgi:putative tricarboxylic transport membrane protein
MIFREVPMQRALLGVDISALILSFLYLWGALGFPRGTMDQPGPGLYPLFVGTLLVIASIGSIITDLVKPAQGELEIPKGKNLGRLLVVAGAAAAYVLLLPYAGHLLAAIMLVFVVLHTMGLTSWPMKIGVTIAIALGSYYLFDILLMVPLPRGIFS